MASGAQKQDISQQKYIEVQDKNNKKKGKWIFRNFSI
jgi:hypothetical protein